MMPKPMDNWEAWFDSNYLRWFHLQEKPALIEIVRITREELTMRGGIKKKSPVMQFRQVQGNIADVKPLVMNKTNMGSIAEALGTGVVKDWFGQQVVLYPTTTEMYDKDVRKMVTRDCIRIRAKKINGPTDNTPANEQRTPGTGESDDAG